MARKNTKTTTTTDTSDALATTVSALTERVVIEQSLKECVRVHLGKALRSLDALAESALDMADEAEFEQLPPDKVRGMFLELANQAALSMVGHIEEITPHEVTAGDIADIRAEVEASQ